MHNSSPVGYRISFRLSTTAETNALQSVRSATSTRRTQSLRRNPLCMQNNHGEHNFEVHASDVLRPSLTTVSVFLQVLLITGSTLVCTGSPTQNSHTRNFDTLDLYSSP